MDLNLVQNAVPALALVVKEDLAPVKVDLVQKNQEVVGKVDPAVGVALVVVVVQKMRSLGRVVACWR